MYPLRRNSKGTKNADFNNWKDEKFEDMESTMCVQQYIQQMIKRDPTDVRGILAHLEGPEYGTWMYEHLRQFCMELNKLTVRLQTQCTPSLCVQMTATEQWIFLCAAHRTPKECSAIDYTRHTLDGAACLLNNNKYFPSRITIKETSINKLGSICRRIYRIFGHAYFHHREIFKKFENETYLCQRFHQFISDYNLFGPDGFLVPIDTDKDLYDSLKVKPTPQEAAPEVTEEPA